MPMKKKKGFTIEIAPEIADILGVQKQDELRVIVRDGEVLLKPKKDDPRRTKQQQEEDHELTKRLIKQYAPVLKKLAKT